MNASKKTTLGELQALKQAGKKFSVLTCYDAATARLMQAAGVEVLLVGDTAAEVVLGLDSTRTIDPEMLLSLTGAVRRGAPDSFVMADLPYACQAAGSMFGTLDWVRRFFEEPDCDAVKIEVTGRDAQLVSAAGDAGIPVVAHLGLLPQYIDPADGYRARGKDMADARALMDDARRLEDAGAAMLLLEAVTSEVARVITRRSRVPVIGCASGPHCDGTVVVLHDMLGLGGGHPPRGVKRYADLADTMQRAFTEYVEDIHAGRFPTEKGVPHMLPGEVDKLNALAGDA